MTDTNRPTQKGVAHNFPLSLTSLLSSAQRNDNDVNGEKDSELKNKGRENTNDRRVVETSLDDLLDKLDSPNFKPNRRVMINNLRNRKSSEFEIRARINYGRRKNSTPAPDSAPAPVSNSRLRNDVNQRERTPLDAQPFIWHSCN